MADFVLTWMCQAPRLSDAVIGRSEDDIHGEKPCKQSTVKVLATGALQIWRRRGQIEREALSMTGNTCAGPDRGQAGWKCGRALKFCPPRFLARLHAAITLHLLLELTVACDLQLAALNLFPSKIS
ncbi:hypothetical protein AcV5_009060 [Taiwanofungus camphoratus]|nr:hypothetical protein AcV5_009060 [Antrodia cinnamomea]